MRDNKKETVEDRKFEESLNAGSLRASRVRQAGLITYCNVTGQTLEEVIATATALIAAEIGYTKTINLLNLLAKETQNFMDQEGITE